MKVKYIICPTCKEKIYEDVDGDYLCNCCGAWRKYDPDGFEILFDEEN